MDSQKTHKAFIQMGKWLKGTSGHNECCSAPSPCSLVHFKKLRATRKYQRASNHEEQRLLKKASSMTLKTESMLDGMQDVGIKKSIKQQH